MKVLVTGANGFVGKAIVSEISKQNSQKSFQIYKLINSDTKSGREVSKNETNIFRADISDYESLLNAVNTNRINEIDVVIHTAGLAHQFGGQVKEDFWRANVCGTENTAKLAVFLKAGHFILISSVAVYGARQTKVSDNPFESGAKGVSEDANCYPKSFYAQSKLESEKAARRICEENKLALTILRLATVIGEEDKGNVARLINSIDKGRFVWIGSGENLKSLIYIGDAAKACLKVIGKTSGIDVFNVTAQPSKMKRIVSEISFNLGKRIPRWKISPKLLEKFFLINAKFTKIKKIDNFAETVCKWLSNDVFSGEKFERVYGFQAETPIGEAIKRQVESYVKLK